jgi:hypothetical protein
MGSEPGHHGEADRIKNHDDRGVDVTEPSVIDLTEPPAIDLTDPPVDAYTARLPRRPQHRVETADESPVDLTADELRDAATSLLELTKETLEEHEKRDSAVTNSMSQLRKLAGRSA